MTADIKAEILAPTKNVVLTKVLSPTGGEILDDAIYNEEKIEVSKKSVIPLVIGCCLKLFFGEEKEEEMQD